MEKLNWGILSTASIAVKHIIPAIKKVDNNKIKAIASRDEHKAEKYAKKFGIKKYYDSYERLIKDPDLDIIYIPLPNTLHKKWVLKTIKEGKNILCEKPLGIDTVEVKEMIKEAQDKNIVLIEGFMYRYQPIIKKLKELVHKKIGELRFLDINFCYKSTRPVDDIRFNKDLGGGSLYDIGCYTIDLARLLIDEKPYEVFNILYKKEDNSVDHSGKALLKFKNNITADLTYSFNSYNHKDFTALGSKGKIVIEDLFEWFPENNRIIEVSTNNEQQKYIFDPLNPYILEIRGIYKVRLRKPLVLVLGDE